MTVNTPIVTTSRLRWNELSIWENHIKCLLDVKMHYHEQSINPPGIIFLKKGEDDCKLCTQVCLAEQEIEDEVGNT